MTNDLVITTRDLCIPSPDVVVQVVWVRGVDVVLNGVGELEFLIHELDFKVIIISSDDDFGGDDVSTTVL